MEVRLRRLNSAKLEQIKTIRTGLLLEGFSLGYELLALIRILLETLHARFVLLLHCALLDKYEGKPTCPCYLCVHLHKSFDLVILAL